MHCTCPGRHFVQCFDSHFISFLQIDWCLISPLVWQPLHIYHMHRSSTHVLVCSAHSREERLFISRAWSVSSCTASALAACAGQNSSWVSLNACKLISTILGALCLSNNPGTGNVYTLWLEIAALHSHCVRVRWHAFQVETFNCRDLPYCFL